MMGNAEWSDSTIYIPLLDEGVEVWRPVEAKHLGHDCYRIVGKPPTDEIWGFQFGATVRCEIRKFASGSEGLVPVETIEL